MVLTGPTLKEAVSGDWFAVCVEERGPDGSVRLTAYRDNYRTRPRAIAYKNYLTKVVHRTAKAFGIAYGCPAPLVSCAPPPTPNYKLLRLKVTVEQIEDLQ